MLVLLLAALPAYATSTGQTGSSVAGCTACHGATADAAVTGDLTGDRATVLPGGTLTLGFVVTSTDADHEIGGLNVSASGGTLVAGFTTKIVGGELTHTRDQHFTGGRATWSFTWTAPAVEGTYSFYSAGLAGDHDHASTGDGWDLDTLTVVVDDGCDDLDGDGFEGCADGRGADCDDTDATISPRGVETCDGVDEDCDTVVDDAPIDGTAYAPDGDGDGWGEAGTLVRSCTPLAGYVANDDDCDDGDAGVSPDGDETCDGVDEDCDGAVDGPGSLDAVPFYRDADADGFGDLDVWTLECSAPVGFTVDTTDCDDTRGAVSPDGVEVCDALDLDEDCDGAADDADADVTGTSTFSLDADGDGYGGATTAEACAAPAGYSAVAGDCDDGSTAYNPGAAEVCDDPTDYNCDGSTGYADADGDGVAACVDCDDGDADARPGGTELCNTRDDDCDGAVDEADAVDAPAWYEDADADGWGGLATTLACTQPDGHVANTADCDDTNAEIRPDAPEVWYDDVDQDCDGDDDDQDGDGFPADTDCDDADATVFPGAQDEPWDGVVTDCNDADEYDADGDGYDLDADCNDGNSAVNPGADEAWYDGVDQDCDGNDDDQDADGVSVSVDCDDTDPAVLVDCDTGDGGDDTAPAVDTSPVDDTDDDTDDGTPDEPPAECGCDATTAPAGAALALLAGLGAAIRRRRHAAR